MKALVLLSGGMDSAVTLAIAKQECNDVYTVSFDYGQKHKFELNQSEIVAKKMNVKKHYTIKVDILQFIKSSLVSDMSDVTQSAHSIENTYVPARNIIFLSLASSLAESLGVDKIYLGVSEEDYGGQRPDTRKVFINKFQELINVGLNCTANEAKTLQLVAPFINKSRKERICKGLELGVDFSLTRTCYQVDSNGVSCGECDSCKARLEAFNEIGIEDPIPYRKRY